MEETERPQFRGAYTYDESSGEVRKTYSLWKRTGKYFISIPVLASAIVVTLVIMTTVFYSQDQMYEDYLHSRPVDFAPKFPTFGHSSSSSAHVNSTFASAGTYNTTAGAVDEPEKSFSLREINNSDFWAATFFYPSLYGIVVSVLTIVFEFIATWLNDFENHRTQTTYINRLILKVFSFQFVTIFTSLYYYAFFLHDQEGAFYQISVTVFSLMTVGQWWSMFLDIVVPSIYHRALLYRMRSAFANTNRKIYRAREYTDKKQRRAETFKQTRKSLNRSLTAIMSEKLDKRMEYLEQGKSKCWEEALQAKYNNFTDYTNMVIQIGFVLFFSAVFPLCPLIALINNLILIRFNALKICYTRQRPIAQKIGGIGVWEDVLQIMSVGGILTNCALYGFTSNQLKNVVTPTFGKTGMAVLLFAYEHTILLFKYWLHGSIPTVHPSVQRARTRERKSCDRKSMLRKEKLTKHGHRRSVLGDHDDQQDGDGGAGGPGGAKKKPLRAQSSMLGYWFDLSNRAAGGTGADQGGAAVGGGARRSLLDQASDDEQEGTSLLQVHASQSVPFSSAVTADAKSHHHRQSNVSHMSRDLKMDCKDDDDDEGSDVCFGNSELEENDDDDAPPPPDCEEDEGPEFEQYASAGAGVYHHRQQLSMARELLDEESLTEYAPPSPHPPQQRTLQPFAQARSSIAQQEAPMQVQVQQGRRRSDSPQPQSTAARDNSPQRAQAHAAGLARDLSPPRDRSPQRSPHRRSLSPSPVRTPPPSTAVLLQPQLQPQPGLHPGGAISRDEMIGIIYANLQNNMLAQLPAEVQLTAPAMSRRVSFVDSGLPAQQHPVCLEPAPSSHAPRRASYVPAAPTTTTNFSAYQQQEYVESGDEDEDNSEYDDFDENVSDLSQNDDEWAEEYDQEEEGAAQGGGGTSNAKGDLWNMSFTTLDSSKHQGKPHRGGAQQGAKGKYLKTKAPTSASAAGGAMSTTKRGSNVKYAAVRSPQQAQQTRSPTKNVVASGASGGPTRQTRTPAAASAPTSATPTPIPSGVQNVQEMISNWFWPTKKETAAAATTSATKASGGANNKASASASGGKHQHSLNLAPLGKNKTAAASVATPVASERKAPASTPITSPVALQFQEVQSPYAALLTPPVVIAPTKNTPGPSATRLHLQDPRDVSPVRTPRGDTTSKETPSGKKATKRTPQPRGVPAATPPSRIFSPPQITSPFSYTEYTPEPSVGMLSQENASILANLQTQQLHQLLLMQQQQAQSSPFISPAPGGKRKLVVSAGAAAVDGSTLVTSTPTGGGGGGGGGINTSPSRSAFAGSRKRHQQQQVLQVLSGHGSPNPYYPILQTGVSDDSAYAATAQGTPVATRPAPQAEKRRSARTPLPFPAAVSAPPAANTPRRRLSVHNNTGGVAPGGTPAAAGAGGKTVTPGVGAVSSSQLNPFSFAAQKRPERVVYD